MFLSYKEMDQMISKAKERGDKSIAFIPIGCMEQHGPFLPLETDSLIAHEISCGVCEMLRQKGFWGYVFPTVHYTPTQTNMSYTGTVSVENRYFRDYVEQVAKAILQHDFDHVIFISGHGPADFLLKEIGFWLVNQQFLEKRNPVRPIFTVSIFEQSAELEGLLGEKPGRHADWREFLLLYKILGTEYFTEEKLTQLKVFQQVNQFDIFHSNIYGIPLELRSTEGVIGNPLPVSTNNWAELADELWDWLILRISGKIETELANFRSKVNM